MFNKKLKNEIYGYHRKEYVCGVYIPGKFVHGLKTRVSTLELENKKLKAIVAELCDYVYRENK